MIYVFQIVGLGLRGVFELIRETKVSHPGLCVRALQAQLDMLQGQQPEGLKHEPPDVIGKYCIYQVISQDFVSLLRRESGCTHKEKTTIIIPMCFLSVVVAFSLCTQCKI